MKLAVVTCLYCFSHGIKFVLGLNISGNVLMEGFCFLAVN